MVAAQDDRTKVPPQVEQFVRLLLVTNKSVSIYPPASDIPRNDAAGCADVLHEVLDDIPDLRLSVTKNGLLYDEIPIFPRAKGFSDFSYELYLRKLSEVRFHAGIEGKDLLAFLGVLQHAPDEVEATGGYEARLWELGVDTITVREMRVTVVEMAMPPTIADHDDQEPIDAAAIDEALAEASAGRDRNRVLLTRLIGDAEGIRNYLQQVYEANSTYSALVAVSERFSLLAEFASAGGGNQYELYRALAAAISGLQAKLQRDLLGQELLPAGRTSPPLAGVVRQLGAASICQLFASGVAQGDIGKGELVKAIRELVLISPSEREEIIETASSVMLEAGISEAELAEILQLATPTRLTVGPDAEVAGPRPAEAVLRLVDFARPVYNTLQVDEQLLELQEEADRGITDGDVIGAMVVLVGLDTRPAQFDSTMSMLEVSLNYLIESGAVEVAADAAVALGEAAKNPALTPEQRWRIEESINRFARPGDVRELAHTLRVYPKGSREHEAAQVLLGMLGHLAIKPLLEDLADEPNMAVRKSLVDLLSPMARDHSAQFGASVSDSRWYFVRNVVAILASAKSSAVLMYLERTLRHPDARVRRETIRGLSGINDPLAMEMLAASLDDDDAQNVQLAARYLGDSGAQGAVSALEAVARGEGRGSRDTGPRVEAIEALGRIGAPQAIPTLESLAGMRTLLSGVRGKELRASATAAIAAIRTKGTV